MDALTSDTVAVVLAGRKGARLDPLTRHVSKPALPFGGAHRSFLFVQLRAHMHGNLAT
jgi:ADP-glucose pyrophosphorylase